MSESANDKSSAILVKLLKLPVEEAIVKLPILCEGDEQLELLVRELYENILDEDRRIEEKKQEKQKSDPTKKNIRIAGGNPEILGYWTRLLLENKRNRLVLLAIFFLVLSAAGYVVRNGFKNKIVFETSEKLESQVRSQAASLKDWIERELQISDALSNSPSIIQITNQLDSLVQLDPSYELIQREENRLSFEARLNEIRQSLGLETMGIFHKRDAVCMLASGETDSLQGDYTYLELRGTLFDYFREAQKVRRTLQIPPLHDRDMIANIPENMELGTFLSFISTIEKDGILIGYLYNSFYAQHKFSKIISNSDFGNSNKVYAFSNTYEIISSPRFESDLHRTYLLDFDSTRSAISNIKILDPGSEIKDGASRAKIKAVDQTFTSIIDQVENDKQSANSLNHGVVMSPYRDYRGVEVVGAWKWLPEQGFGLIAEIDADDAYAPIRYFDSVLVLFYLILALLLFAAYRLNTKFISFGKKITDLQLLGQYELVKKIGEGGFGKVYKGRHRQLKSDVAIKLLKKELNDTDALERFEKEVKITSSLKHPNTIRVYDYGTTDDGQFYYVMEFLNGISLNTVVNSYNRFPVNRAIYILLESCYSLEEAHTRNLIHRDIKPENIMLCNQGGHYDQVKVLDFGLVKNLDTSATQQTQINRIGGTPMFMSPERLRDPYNADQRVDIYSLGALGLYMLSGQYVVELISQKMLSGTETLQGNLNFSIFERDDIPKEFMSLLLQCVHFSVDKRPANLKEVIRTLEALAKDYPWTRGEAQNWWQSYDIYDS